MATAAPTRTRLSPEARRDQLLDTAKSMILAEGLQAFTMEALARAASVSSPLVYNYFSSRLELLRALLEREYARYGAHVVGALRDAQDFEQIVRVCVAANFDHHAPGTVLPVLLSQPEIAESIRDAEKKASRRTAKFLVDRIERSYAIGRPQAEQLISMASGASIAAAGYAARSRVGRERAIDRAVAFILAGIRLSVSDQPLAASVETP